MNRQEAAALAAYAIAGGLRTDAEPETLAEVWADALPEIQLADAKQATARLIRERAFLDAANIASEVKRIRSERIERFGPRPAPNGGEYPRELRAMTRAIANGAFTRAMIPAYEANPSKRFVDGTFTPEIVSRHRALPSEAQWQTTSPPSTTPPTPSTPYEPPPTKNG